MINNTELSVRELTISRYKNKSGATTKINLKNNEMSHSTLKCQCRKRMGCSVPLQYSCCMCLACKQQVEMSKRVVVKSMRKAGNEIKSQSKEVKAKVMILCEIYWENVHYQHIQKVH